MSNQILIIDDDAGFRFEFKEYFSEYDIGEASDGNAAIQLLKSANNIDLAILDVRLPGINGIEVLKEIKRIAPEIKTIILTGYSSKDVVINALKGDADDYLEKPINIDKTKEIIERLLGSKQSGKDIDTGDISGKIRKVKNFVERNCCKKTCLSDVSRVVGLSPKYLSRVFKENTGMNFSEYRLKMKMGKAKELLTKSGYNINQISEKVGYENAESFIRQFISRIKYTPSQYRKKYQKKELYNATA